MDNATIKDLIGKTLIKIENEGDEITFTCDDQTQYKMYHPQDCCENVYIESIIGDLNDLIGYVILKASEDDNSDKPSDVVREYEPDSETWTFYNIATIKGHVTIRWCGESNGYYSESVYFIKL